jgi:hypothetical protein
MQESQDAASAVPPRLSPWNAALRFALELAALFALGRAGARFLPGWLGTLAMIGLPSLAAVVWATFTVPGDPSRGKVGPRPVSGAVRLAVEGAFFGCGCAALAASNGTGSALIFAACVVVHYGFSHARTRWLLTQHGPRSTRI